MKTFFLEPMETHAVEVPAPALQETATKDEVLSRHRFDLQDWSVLVFLAGVCLYLARVNVVRAFYLLQINSNEGFNAYNALRALQHNLYPAKYSWTAVNYPFLSFYLIGHLSSIFGDPMFIGRALSLLSLALLCVLTGLIVHRLTGSAKSGIFAAIFCCAIFNAMAPDYVGMNDPQMMAQVFFLLGLFIYLKHPASNTALAFIVVLFAIGANIKQNPIAAPIAVLIDLAVVSRARAVRFAIFGLLAAAVSYAANVWIGGPYFVSQLLTPRLYNPAKLVRCVNLLLPATASILLASIWSAFQLKNVQLRVIGLYSLVALALGVFFYGGRGTAMNVYFDLLLALSIIMGILLHTLWNSTYAPCRAGSPWRLALPVVFLSGLYTYLPLHGPIRDRLLAKQQAFQTDVAFIAAQPGPSICEDILECFYARKPFVYAPFNSTSLVRLGKLDSKEIVGEIAAKRFGAIETEGTIPELASEPHTDHFTPEILQTIGANYRIGRQGPRTVTYIPR